MLQLVYVKRKLFGGEEDTFDKETSAKISFRKFVFLTNGNPLGNNDTNRTKTKKIKCAAKTRTPRGGGGHFRARDALKQQFWSICV